jgi:hypothetical protein
MEFEEQPITSKGSLHTTKEEEGEKYDRIYYVNCSIVIHQKMPENGN